MHDVTAHQRLAAGDPQLAHPAIDEHAAEPIEFFQRQQIALGQELHVLGHAVGTAEVAAIRHRDAEIGDRPLERVDQRRRPDRCEDIVGGAPHTRL
jgi:hypothetical protein